MLLLVRQEWFVVIYRGRLNAWRVRHGKVCGGAGLMVMS